MTINDVIKLASKSPISSIKKRFRNKKYKDNNYDYPIRDMMNGIIQVYSYGGKKRGYMWKRMILKHCHICTKIWVVHALGDNTFKATECSNDCRRKSAQLQEEPIMYNGKLYTLDDCSDYIKSRYYNPIKQHVNRIKYGEEYNQLEYVKKRNAKTSAEYRERNPLTEEQRIAGNIRNNQNYYNNREERLKQQKEYNQRPEVRVKRKKRLKIYYDKPINAIKHRIGRNLRQFFERYVVRGIEYTGDKYSYIDFKGIFIHLIKLLKEMGKTFEDIKDTHHIDHIIPQSEFSLEELHLAYHPLNLRWLPASENMSKNNRIRPEDIDVIKAIPRHLWPKGFRI
tara:strand:- start:444 stop:1460 length:1017 start_codon:yes stop_codon:yes gene_type:complete